MKSYSQPFCLLVCLSVSDLTRLLDGQISHFPSRLWGLSVLLANHLSINHLQSESVSINPTLSTDRYNYPNVFDICLECVSCPCDPPENCRLNGKKLTKTCLFLTCQKWLFFKKFRSVSYHSHSSNWFNIFKTDTYFDRTYSTR